MFKRLAALFLLLMASVWPALVNGHPFFFPDTSNYVRGPDFTIVYFLGKKFATSWTQDRTLQGVGYPSPHTIAGTDRNVGLNSPLDKAILAGRSIYYGAFLYLGHITSYFWLIVFVQALIFLYLSHTFILKCLRLPFSKFAWTISTIVVATSVSFFISFLMPDVFASFLILATIIVVGFWDILKLRDKIFISAILLYSALAHISHFLLLVCLILVFLCVSIIAEGKTILSGSTPKKATILSAVVLAAFLGELAFTYGVRVAIGADPIRPPSLMARVIADGPGYRFLQKNCVIKLYVVCNYITRLPSSENVFLFSPDPNKGVFAVADLETRRALSSEQFSFVLDVFRFDPIGLSTSMLRNFIHQLLAVGIQEFFTDRTQIQAYKEKVPEFYFNELLHSNMTSQHWIFVAGANAWYSSVYILSTMGLVLAWVFWPFVQFPKKLDIFSKSQWFYILSIAVAGVFFNAAICGTLAGVFSRYQSRISWIPPFVLIVMVVNLSGVLSDTRAGTAFRRRMQAYLGVTFLPRKHWLVD
jgi:hypothetical protein